MNGSNIFFAVVAVLFAVALLHRVIKYRGLRGAFFGASVVGRIAEIELANKTMHRTRLRVYELETSIQSDAPAAGLEVVMSGLGYYQIVSLPLSRGDVLRLSQALDQATSAHARLPPGGNAS